MHGLFLHQRRRLPGTGTRRLIIGMTKSMPHFMIDHHYAVSRHVPACGKPGIRAAIPAIVVDDHVLAHTATVFGGATRRKRGHILRFGKHDIEVTVSFRALHERSTGTRPSALIVENTVDGIGEVIERTDITLLRYAIGVLRGFMAVIPCRLLGLGENLVPLVIGQRCRLMLDRKSVV